MRKETIERILGTAKENHGFRYTQIIGKARMEMKAGLTFACLNLKKLAKMKQRLGLLEKCFGSLMIIKQKILSFERKWVLRFVF